MLPAPDPGERLRASLHLVLLACLPGLLALTWLHGWGTLLNLLLTTTAALATEAVLLRAQRRPVRAALGDGSALVSATLLAIALPAYLAWWVPVIASASALALGKHVRRAWQESVQPGHARLCRGPGQLSGPDDPVARTATAGPGHQPRSGVRQPSDPTPGPRRRCWMWCATTRA